MHIQAGCSLVRLPFFICATLRNWERKKFSQIFTLTFFWPCHWWGRRQDPHPTPNSAYFIMVEGQSWAALLEYHAYWRARCQVHWIFMRCVWKGGNVWPHLPFRKKVSSHLVNSTGLNSGVCLIILFCSSWEMLCSQTWLILFKRVFMQRLCS